MTISELYLDAYYEMVDGIENNNPIKAKVCLTDVIYYYNKLDIQILDYMDRSEHYGRGELYD